jgi:hypothetical protein
MKKLLFLFTGIATAAGLTSCKKEYTCECTYTSSYTSTIDPSYSYVDNSTFTYLLEKQSKNDATALCDSYSYSYYSNDGGIIEDEVSCALK